MLTTGSPESVPGFTRPGQRTIIGTRMPPSYRCPFDSRNGRQSDTPAKPPLSLVNTTSVSSSKPSASSDASSRPTARSIASIIAP